MKTLQVATFQFGEGIDMAPLPDTYQFVNEYHFESIHNLRTPL
jgi:hypothetical protein